MGANVSTLISLLRSCGALDARARTKVALLLGSAALRAPLTAVESAWVRVRMRNRSVPPPIFIVGHWRSGTTLLHNLLRYGPFSTLSSQTVGIPWNSLFLGLPLRLLAPLLLPPDRFIDRMPVHIDSPQEDESALAAMVPLSFFHGIYFPALFREHIWKGVFHEDVTSTVQISWARALVHLHKKVALASHGKREVIKNPVHTARIALLRRIFPGAQFIHIVRNPYEVFPSMRNFYRRLLAQYSLQAPLTVPIDEVVLAAYSEMMRRLLVDTCDLSPNEYHEVRFEDLLRNPEEQLQIIYDALGLPGFASSLPGVRAYLCDVRDYRQNEYRYTARDCRLVESRWGDFIARWHYRRPAVAT